MNKKKLIHKTFLILSIVITLTSIAAASEKPNMIVILADDLGFGDVSCYGATALSTPNIDRLAAEGMRFTNGYCSASTCTPTRFSLLTGKYAFRQKGTGIAAPNATALIQPSTTTIASILKQAGYATAVVGKWHLGLGAPPQPDWNGDIKPGPLEIGFDYCFLLPTTNDRVPGVYVENHRVRNLDPGDPLWVSLKNLDNQPTGKDPDVRKTLKLDWSHGHNSTVHNGIGRIGFCGGGKAARWRDEDLADEWVKQSNKWIEAQVTKNRDKPFFLYFASHDIHVPRMPNERFHGKTSLGLRGDAIMQLDWCVGELIKTLQRLKIADNTLIVFCSDNGPVLDDGYKDRAMAMLGDHKPSGLFRGGKYSVYEGGTRTPFITWWPKRIKPGTSDKIVCTIDLSASVAALTGVKLEEGDCPDSFNVLGAMLGDKKAKGRDHLVQQSNSLIKIALRVGDWKLLEITNRRTKKKTVSLFNLAEDIGEKNDLAAKYPQKVSELKARFEAIKNAKQTRN